MEFDGNNRDDDDDDDGFDDRDDEDDDRPPAYEDEDREDFFDSSLDSDFSRDSKQMLEESFFVKRHLLPNTQIMNSEIGFYDEDDESINPLEILNYSDPNSIGSMRDLDSQYQSVDPQRFKVYDANELSPGKAPASDRVDFERT